MYNAINILTTQAEVELRHSQLNKPGFCVKVEVQNPPFYITYTYQPTAGNGVMFRATAENAPVALNKLKEKIINYNNR